MSDAASASGGKAAATANICNTRGLHARASAKFVKLASSFDAEVHVTRDGVTVNALSIMGLLMLGPATAAASRSPPRGPRPRRRWLRWPIWSAANSTRTSNENAPPANRRGAFLGAVACCSSAYGVSVISRAAEAVPPLKVPIQMS